MKSIFGVQELKTTLGHHRGSYSRLEPLDVLGAPVGVTVVCQADSLQPVMPPRVKSAAVTLKQTNYKVDLSVYEATMSRVQTAFFLKRGKSLLPLNLYNDEQ